MMTSEELSELDGVSQALGHAQVELDNLEARLASLDEMTTQLMLNSLLHVTLRIAVVLSILACGVAWVR